ncbi:MAG: hypothetical protein R8M45_01445 [Ghiorsea sp.]
MSDFIEDDNEEIKDPDYVTRHREAFNVPPIIIGMFWNNQSKIIRLVDEAIKKGVPYNEENFLSKDDLVTYRNGGLFF